MFNRTVNTKCPWCGKHPSQKWSKRGDGRLYHKCTKNPYGIRTFRGTVQEWEIEARLQLDTKMRVDPLKGYESKLEMARAIEAAKYVRTGTIITLPSRYIGSIESVVEPALDDSNNSESSEEQQGKTERPLPRCPFCKIRPTAVNDYPTGLRLYVYSYGFATAFGTATLPVGSRSRMVAHSCYYLGSTGVPTRILDTYWIWLHNLIKKHSYDTAMHGEHGKEVGLPLSYPPDVMNILKMLTRAQLEHHKVFGKPLIVKDDRFSDKDEELVQAPLVEKCPCCNEYPFWYEANRSLYHWYPVQKEGFFGTKEGWDCTVDDLAVRQYEQSWIARINRIV